MREREPFKHGALYRLDTGSGAQRANDGERGGAIVTQKFLTGDMVSVTQHPMDVRVPHGLGNPGQVGRVRGYFDEENVWVSFTPGSRRCTPVRATDLREHFEGGESDA